MIAVNEVAKCTDADCEAQAVIVVVILDGGDVAEGAREAATPLYLCEDHMYKVFNKYVELAA